MISTVKFVFFKYYKSITLVHGHTLAQRARCRRVASGSFEEVVWNVGRSARYLTLSGVHFLPFVILQQMQLSRDSLFNPLI